MINIEGILLRVKVANAVPCALATELCTSDDTGSVRDTTGFKAVDSVAFGGNPFPLTGNLD